MSFHGREHTTHTEPAPYSISWICPDNERRPRIPAQRRAPNYLFVCSSTTGANSQVACSTYGRITAKRGSISVVPASRLTANTRRRRLSRRPVRLDAGRRTFAPHCGDEI